jgi:hypothetical protein
MHHTNVYAVENEISKKFMKDFVSHLSSADLRRPLDAGWTVASILVHLAFWDQRALILIEKWKNEGIGPSPMDTDVVNEATRTFFLAIPPHTAAEMALACAAAIDREVAGLTPEMIAEIEDKGKPVRLNRSVHRREHLEQIKRALGMDSKTF